MLAGWHVAKAQCQLLSYMRVAYISIDCFAPSLSESLKVRRGPGAPRQARISSSPLKQLTWWGCWGCSARGLLLLRVVDLVLVTFL